MTTGSNARQGLRRPRKELLVLSSLLNYPYLTKTGEAGSWHCATPDLRVFVYSPSPPCFLIGEAAYDCVFCWL
jgi:hypothetical protein